MLRAGLESLALRLGGLACTFLLGVLLARALGPADYGSYGLIVSVGALIASICPLGTPQLAVREFAVRAAGGRWREGWARLLSFQRAAFLAWAAFGGLALAWTILARDRSPDRLLPWAIGMLTALFLAFGMISASALRGIGAMREGQVIDIVGRPAMVLAISGLIVLLAGRPAVTVILSVQLAGTIGGAMLGQWWFLRRIRAMPDDPGAAPAGRWLGQALPLGLVDAIRQFDATYALILMGWLSGRAELGLFRVALACGAVANMAISIVHVILAPRVSQLFHAGRTEELQALLARVSLTMIGLSLTMLAALIVAGRQAIVLAFGPAFAGAWAPLVLLAAGQAGFGLFGMGPVLLAMAGRERPLTLIYLVATGSGVATAIPLIRDHGAIGAAIAQTVSLTLVGALSDLHARRRLGLRTSLLRIGRRSA